jgi:hypothetical protein
VSSSKSGIKQIKPLIKQKMYAISNMALATLHFVIAVRASTKRALLAVDSFSISFSIRFSEQKFSIL